MALSSVRLVSVFAMSCLLSLQSVQAQTAMEYYSDRGCAHPIEPNPASYSRVVRDLVSSKTVDIDGSEWNDTLIVGCEIDGAGGDGIQIRNVRNLAIVGCTIKNVRGTGIRIRSTGSTTGVQLIGNRIVGTGENGISAAKRVKDEVDHTNLVIAGNQVRDTGKRGKRGLYHGIYSQVSDVTIFRNRVEGDRDGNGISIRSSGLVACNAISGRSDDDKPGIRYFADNYSGPSRLLIIRDNEIRGSSPAIDIRTPDSWAKRDTDALVTTFVVENNRTTSDEAVSVDDYWLDLERARLTLEGNRRIGG